MQVNSIADVAFAFGPFRLIPSKQLLVRQDRRVKLSSRALDILHLLVMKAGDEVSKDDLIEFAWPSVFVNESNLKVHISSLRRALEDTLPDATYIATVIGRGYQFVGNVQTERPVTAMPPESSNSIRSTLPKPPFLVGRERDIRDLSLELASSTLITLVGPGGVGKSSLAMSVANSKRSDFPDGAYFIDLSATSNPEALPQLLATSMGVSCESADLITRLASHLRDKCLLIVLDNCEHVLHAAATIVSQLLRIEIRSRVLATSREPLRVRNEHVQRVEPLAFPREVGLRTLRETLAYPAIELFALCALQKANYELLESDTEILVTLCQRLEGLPLQIEIAAATLDRFSPAQLLEAVQCDLIELQNEGPAIPLRHRTIRGTLDWSYQLLTREESALFRLLSVFASSFSVSDITTMSHIVGFSPYQTTAALGGLVAKSLLWAKITGDQLRYRLSSTAQVYAAEQLKKDTHCVEAHCQHAQIVLSALRNSETKAGMGTGDRGQS